MRTDTFFIMSKTDELLLSVFAAEPENPDQPVKGIVQIVHGTREHKERYLPFMQYMTDAGYACICHDHRGHGKSVRNPEDLGYMYSAGMDGFLSDVHQITKLARKRWPDLPVIQFGHGSGALAVLCMLRKWEEAVSCVILSGCPCINHLAAAGTLLAKLRRGTYRRGRSKLLKQITAMPYDKRFPGERTEYNWLCRNQEAVEEYNEDPLCGFELAADGQEVVLNLMRSAYRKGRWKTAKQDLPILFIGGADDPYIGTPALFHQTLKAVRNLGYNNVKGKLYPQLRHEILNEEEKFLVFGDVEKYLDLVLGQTSVEQ
ncbi:MAG: alpha/beta fold hydrolase [Lachnospiraceae bacterium]|nr:alpha/beta fold hydrolase [Lachnospiraceae bacterium]